MRAAPAQLDGDGLYQKAVRALAQRGRTETELRRLLTRRASSAQAVDEALARLRDHGYLDDARLSVHAAAYQKDVLRHGRGRALRDLRARGVASSTAAAAVQSAYGRETPAQEDALVRAFVAKKRIQRPADARQAASFCRKLILAGFSPAACQRALRAWRADSEWLEMVDTIELDGTAMEAE